LQGLRYPFLHAIDGLTFSYRRQHVDYFRSLSRAGLFCMSGLARNVERIQREAKRIRPALFVCDFEPTVARAARLSHRPLVSVDNQHRFVHCGLTDLPLALRTYARVAGCATRLMIPRPDHVVISSFHNSQPPRASDRITLTHGLLRKAVEQTTVGNDGFILAYVRPSICRAVLDSLAGVDRAVRVYGAGDNQAQRYAADSRFHFHPLSPDFVADLARCDRLVASAGHQLICEAQFFRKPLLAIPEPGQYEQHINAWYAEQTGLGQQCRADRLTSDRVNSFLTFRPQHTARAENGVRRVVEVLHQALGG
jgi:uncharacterized protein (TIGR00661 family)